MLLCAAFFVWHAALTSPAYNSRKIQKLKASASAGNGTLADIETLAAAYQAAERAWDACYLIRGQWAKDKENNGLIQLVAAYPL